MSIPVNIGGDDAHAINLLRKNKMGKPRIHKKGTFEILLECYWLTNKVSENYVSILVTEYGINVAATSTLNLSGIAALEQALAVAKIFYANQVEID